MAQIPAYNTNNVEEILANAGGSMPLIDEGVYKAVVVKSELKDTKSGGKFLALTFVLTEGKHRNTEFVERLNIINSNTTAQKIAYETMARIAKAAGLQTLPTDSVQLHNKPMLIKVVTEEAKSYIDNEGQTREGKPKSIIDSRGYTAVGGAGNAPKQVFDDEDAVNPSTAAGASVEKMPWER